MSNRILTWQHKMENPKIQRNWQRRPHQTKKKKKKKKKTKKTQCALDTNIRKKAQITLIRHGTLSCAMCFLIALTLYNRINHVNVKYHKPPVWNCHSKDKHSINSGILIPSTTKYINMCSILFIVSFYFII